MMVRHVYGEEFRSETFFYFQQECNLAKSLIIDGLVNFYKFNVDPYSSSGVGYAYNGFFGLSIAVERLAKLALIFHYAKENGNDDTSVVLPTGGSIRQAGHDLNKLFKNLRDKISQELQHSVDNEERLKLQHALDLFDLPNISSQILDFLSDFAKFARYENLDKLSGNGSRTEEPLRVWEGILRDILNNPPFEKHERTEYANKLNGIYSQKYNKDGNQKDIYQLGDGYVVSFLRDHLSERLNPQEMDFLSKMYKKFFPCVYWYILCILKPIIYVVNKWGRDSHVINLRYVFKDQNNYKLADIPEVWEIFPEDKFDIPNFSEFIKFFEEDPKKILWF